MIFYRPHGRKKKFKNIFELALEKKGGREGWRDGKRRKKKINQKIQFINNKKNKEEGKKMILPTDNNLNFIDGIRNTLLSNARYEGSDWLNNRRNIYTTFNRRTTPVIVRLRTNRNRIPIGRSPRLQRQTTSIGKKRKRVDTLDCLGKIEDDKNPKRRKHRKLKRSMKKHEKNIKVLESCSTKLIQVAKYLSMGDGGAEADGKEKDLFSDLNNQTLKEDVQKLVKIMKNMEIALSTRKSKIDKISGNNSCVICRELLTEFNEYTEKQCDCKMKYCCSCVVKWTIEKAKFSCPGCRQEYKF